MSVKVAINGFGRIGRLAFRQMFGAEGYEVVAINDLTSPKMLAHLLKYDSSQGRYVNFGEEDQVTADDEAGTITVKGKTIKIYKEPDANNCPWGEIGVDVVLECSGFYTSKAKAQAHINAGAKKVVISAPAGNDLKTIVYNVNHETLTAEDKIITLSTCCESEDKRMIVQAVRREEINDVPNVPEDAVVAAQRGVVNIGGEETTVPEETTTEPVTEAVTEPVTEAATKAPVMVQPVNREQKTEPAAQATTVQQTTEAPEPATEAPTQPTTKPTTKETTTAAPETTTAQPTTKETTTAAPESVTPEVTTPAEPES